MNDSSHGSEVTSPSTERIVSLANTNTSQRASVPSQRNLEPLVGPSSRAITTIATPEDYRDYLITLERECGQSKEERKAAAVKQAREKYPDPFGADGVEVEEVFDSEGERTSVLVVDAEKIPEEDILQLALSAFNGPDPPKLVFAPKVFQNPV